MGRSTNIIMKYSVMRRGVEKGAEKIFEKIVAEKFKGYQTHLIILASSFFCECFAIDYKVE